ncbi:hypothetical protein MMC29_000018 [Sticta canariensis]|nr:hypothetical protein [Sticta canariensis]
MPAQGHLLQQHQLHGKPCLAPLQLRGLRQQRVTRAVFCQSGAGKGGQQKEQRLARNNLRPLRSDAGSSELGNIQSLQASNSEVASTSSGGSGDRPKDGPGGGGGGGGGDGSGSSDDAKALLIGAGKSLESLPAGVWADYKPEAAEGLGLSGLTLTGDNSCRYCGRSEGRQALQGYCSAVSGVARQSTGSTDEHRVGAAAWGPGQAISLKWAAACSETCYSSAHWSRSESGVIPLVGIGIFTKSSAEYSKRGKHFFEEADFVAANIAMALVADFMLVWLPAPTLAFSKKTSSLPGSNSAMARFLRSCPDNAFQRVRPGSAPFTVGQRTGAILRNGAKLLAVGFGSSMIGVGATQALSAIRTFLDPEFSTPNPPQSVLSVSAAYASFMGINSNLRYQFIAGIIEERGIEVAFKNNPKLCHVLSLIVRTGNTFAGSLMWIDYLRLLGMQPKGD